MKEKDSKLKNMLITGIVGIAIASYTGFFNFMGNDIYDIVSPFSKFYMDTEMEIVTAVFIDNKQIPMFSGTKGSDPKYSPLIAVSLSNENKSTADIKKVKIEVCNYKTLDEFIVENPCGGGEDREIKKWQCDISKESSKMYDAIYIGNESKEINDKYICIESGDSEELEILIYPDTPGLYEIRAVVDYTFKSKRKSLRSDKMKFIFDPNGEINIAPNKWEKYLFKLKRFIFRK